MILDDVRLGDAVADLNRYGGVQIVLADSNLAAIRVSGVSILAAPAILPSRLWPPSPSRSHGKTTATSF